MGSATQLRLRNQRRAALLAIVLLAALSFLAWVHWAGEWNAWRAERQFERAMALPHVEQQTALRSLLELQPTHAEALWRLFELELAGGQQELAYLRLQNLIELHPSDPRAWVAMAGALRSAGLLVEAQKSLSRALSADPSQRDARLQRLQLRLSLGQLSAAGRDLERLRSDGLDTDQIDILQQSLAQATRAENSAAANPRRGSGQFWPGKLARLVGQTLQAARDEDWALAQSFLQQAELDYPTTMFAPWLAGVVALNRADVDGAIESFSEALIWAPRSHRVLGLMTRARAQRDGAQATARWLHDLAQADPGYELAWVTAAQVYMELRQPAEAENLLRSAIPLAAAGAIPFKQLALLYQQLDRPAEALRVCEQGLQRFPRQAELQQIRAELSLRHQPEQALAMLEAWLAVDVDNNRARALLAQALVKSGSGAPERARKLLEAISADGETEPATLSAVGQSYLALKQPALALRSFDAALTQQPDAAPLQYFRAQALLASGEKLLALQQLRRVLATELNFPQRVDALRLVHLLEEEIGSP